MKKIILVCTFLIACLVVYNVFCIKDNLCVSKISNSSECDQAIINTYLSRIKQASDEFYKDYYLKLPQVMYYTVNLKKIEQERSNSIITFISYPYLGPHDTIGIDEITFKADHMGNIKFEEFKHIKSYHLPDNLKSLEKKVVPGKYE